MVDLSTDYLGFTLKNPLVVAASPLSEDLGNIRKMEDAEASAIVLFSLFEEQIMLESNELDRHLSHGEHYAEAISYYPDIKTFKPGPDRYLEHIRLAKEAVGIPIIGSLNGVSAGGWTEYAKNIEEAGADALELNTYYIPTDLRMTGAEVEKTYCDLVREVKACLKIPIAVKIGHHFSAIANMCRRLDEAGADALVLFNRFYQPDFDLENLEVKPNLTLSDPFELLLRLHWVAILYSHLKADLAITGGIHSAEGVLKSMMAGAKVATMASALLHNGLEHLATVKNGLIAWMEENEYGSIRQMQGSMSHRTVTDPAAFERGNYLKVLSSYTHSASK